MAAQEILKEFLVAIGVKINEGDTKKTFDSIDKITKNLVTMTVAAEAAALGVVAALGKMAQSFEKAYYSSSRTGAPISELKAFAYAASQTGSSAEEATTAIEGLAEKIRTNRGFGTLVKGLTHDQSDDWAKQVRELGAVFSHMTSEQAHATAAMLGIPEHLLLAFQSPEFTKFYDDQMRKAGRMGIDLQKAGEDGKDLTRVFRDMQSTLDLIGDAAGSVLFDKLNKPLQDLNSYLEVHGKDIANIIAKIAGALLELFTSVIKYLPDLDHLAEKMGGWNVVFEGLAAIISIAFVGRLAGLFGSLRALSLLAMPPWLLAILGVGAAGAWGLNKIHEGASAESMPSYEEAGKATTAEKFYGKVKRFFGGGAGRRGFMMRGHEGPLGDKLLDPMRPGAARSSHGGWWTAENQKHAFDRLTAGGMNPTAAIALISRWKNVESAGGPTSLNPKSGAFGIIQGLGPRKPRSANVDDQLDDVLKEYKTGSGDGPYVKASEALASARTDREGAVGASAYERAEGYKERRDGTDDFTQRTLDGMAEVRRNVVAAKTPPMLRPGALGSAGVVAAPNPLYPGQTTFNPSLAAPPLGSQSSDNSKSVTVIDNSKTSVSGVSDPQKAADHIGRIGDRQSSLLLRNVQSAVG